MARVALISCTKTKASEARPAGLLYQSALFKKSLLYALSVADRVYILSAKHGVLGIQDVVEPYELSIKQLSAEEKQIWSLRVSARLEEILSPNDKVHLLAGADYMRPLLPTFHKIGCQLVTPLSGQSLGKRISWLGQSNREQDLNGQFIEFYTLMRQLYVGQSAGRLVGESTGKLDWPKRGVYFLLEPGERLMTKRFRPLGDRIVRVGTHGVSVGSKATLWNRLSTHRGATAGSGNHRSSIFRLHIGAALMRRSPELWYAPQWGVGQSAGRSIQETEVVLERAVSEVLGQMRLLWLNVPDDPSPSSDRAYIERNAIGLLSRYAVIHGGQNSTWLGRFSKQINISLSGLWNLDHLFYRPDPAFCDVLAKYVDVTLGLAEPPTQPLAPIAWYRKTTRTDSSQLSLFSDDTAKPALHRK
jgi:hypothetical protein